MLLHVVGAGELLGATYERAQHCLLGSMDFGVSGGVAGCGEGLAAVVGVLEPARVALPWPFCTSAAADIVVVRNRPAIAESARALRACMRRYAVGIIFIGRCNNRGGAVPPSAMVVKRC